MEQTTLQINIINKSAKLLVIFKPYTTFNLGTLLLMCRYRRH